MRAYQPTVDRGISSLAAEQLKAWIRRRRAHIIARDLPLGRALEIGCGRGWLLEALRDAGWHVAGIEGSPAAAVAARRLGLEVRAGDIRACGFRASFFDLIVLWHSLEHLPDPLGTLTEAHRLLRPGGRLIVATPNADSWQARVAGPNWYHLDVPRHLYHFSPHTLNAMLKAAGFEGDRRIAFVPILRCGKRPEDGPSSGFLDPHFSPRGWLFCYLTYEFRGWLELVRRGPWPDVIAWGLAIAMLPPGLVLAHAAAHWRAGAAMVVYAQKTRDDPSACETAQESVSEKRVITLACGGARVP